LNHPRSAGFILRKFADDSAFVVTTAAWEIRGREPSKELLIRRYAKRD